MVAGGVQAEDVVVDGDVAVTAAAELLEEDAAALEGQAGDGEVVGLDLEQLPLVALGAAAKRGVVVPTGATGVAVADFNGDGRADLLFRAATTLVLQFSGDTTFSADTTVKTSAGANRAPLDSSWVLAEAADYGRDRNADIVWQNIDGSTAVWLMNGTTMTSGTGIVGVGTGWSVSAVSQ